MLAAFLVLAAVAAVVLDAHPAVIVAGVWAACTTKEFAFALVGAMAITALFGMPGPRRRPVRRTLLAVGAGMLAGVITNALMNEFRYAALTNQDYLRSSFHVHGLGLTAKLFAALLFAPNGGITLFWSTAVAVIVAGGVIGLAAWRRPGGRWWPGAAVLLIFLGINLSLARWWQPFGWIAWGPRLTLPWLPGLALLSVALYGRELSVLTSRVVRSTAGAVSTGVLALVAGLPQVAVLWATDPGSNVFSGDSICVPGAPPGSSLFYRCLQHEAWGRHLMLDNALSGLTVRSGALVAAAYALAILGLVVMMRRVTGASPLGPAATKRPGARLAADSTPVYG
jgi:hypothetical protein